MITYITSDTHFGHEALLHLGVYSRPEGFEKLLKVGLGKIKKDDMLIHLGDICIRNDSEHHKEYIESLPCRKLLVRGNHDRKTTHRYLTHGRDWVVDRYYMEVKGEKILLSHIPIPVEELPKGRYNIHGHIHDRAMPPLSNYHKLYSAEREYYKPKNIEHFIPTQPTNE